MANQSRPEVTLGQQNGGYRAYWFDKPHGSRLRMTP